MIEYNINVDSVVGSLIQLFKTHNIELNDELLESLIVTSLEYHLNMDKVSILTKDPNFNVDISVVDYTYLNYPLDIVIKNILENYILDIDDKLVTYINNIIDTVIINLPICKSTDNDYYHISIKNNTTIQIARVPIEVLYYQNLLYLKVIDDE